MNEEVKGWTSLSKQQKSPPETTNTKEEIRFEQMKREVKKSLMYVDHYLPGDIIKYKLIDEL